MSTLYPRRKFLTLLSASAIAASCSKPQQLGSPAPNDAEGPIRFVVVGDVGRGNRGQYAVARAMEQHFRQAPFPFILMTGDNIYEDGEIEKLNKVFERPYRALLNQGVKFRAVLGNHDIRENNGDQQVAYPLFNMDGRYYSFRQDEAEFFALDTNKNADWDGQLAWLESALSASNATWKIAYGHHPIYSSGKHGNHPRLEEKLCPLFKQYAVQLYCCGHDHHYERTQPIDGTTYVVAGGGSETRPVGKSSWTAYSEKVLSFASVKVSDKGLVITGIDTENNVIDQGVIPQGATARGA